MIRGNQLSLIVIAVTGGLFITFYSSTHHTFSTAIILYCIASIISNYTEICLVTPTLQFNYKIVTISEAVSFSVNTFSQWTLISLMGVDPCVAFGLSYLLGSITRAVIALYFCLKESYPIDFQLKPLKTSKSETRYVLEEMVKIAWQIAPMSYFLNFFTQIYFVTFLSKAEFNGELTLIRKFEDLATRFIFSPIDVKKLKTLIF